MKCDTSRSTPKSWVRSKHLLGVGGLGGDVVLKVLNSGAIRKNCWEFWESSLGGGGLRSLRFSPV